MKDGTLLESILELKNKCDFENTIAESFRITVSELRFLLALDAEQNVCVNEVCGKLCLSKSRGSRIMGGLVRKGFVAVSTDKRDKRFSRLALTPSGRTCSDSIRIERDRCEGMLRTRLRSAQYATAKRTIRSLLALM